MSIETIDRVPDSRFSDVPTTHELHDAQRQQTGTTTDTESYVPTKRDEKIIVATLVGFLVYELLGLFGWLFFAGLAGMAFDAGFTWQAALVAGPIFLYPLFILLCWLGVPFLMAKKRHSGAIVLGIAPPVLAFGPIVLYLLGHRFVSWLVALF